MVATPSPEAPPPGSRGGKPPLRRFWARVSEGLEAQQLWDSFRSEARASYELYRREVHWEATAGERGFRHGRRVLQELIWAFLSKLSPARRVFLLLAVAVAWLGHFDFAYRGHHVDMDLRGWGFVLLLVLLGLELADRVTMKRDLEIARQIQRWLVPENPPRAPGMDIAFTTIPANTVAGDYYDAFFRDAEGKRLLLAVADVAGKSVPAALLMATFQASLHSTAPDCDGPLPLAERLNQFACRRSLEGRRFTTAFLAELDVDGRELHYVNAGHNPPVLRRARGGVERLEEGGLPFGIDPGARYESGVARLETGDLLLIFTDGLVEANNEAGDEFGDPRMLEALGELGHESAEGAIRGLVERVEGFAGETRQYDDITCLAVRLE